MTIERDHLLFTIKGQGDDGHQTQDDDLLHLTDASYLGLQRYWAYREIDSVFFLFRNN